MFKEQSIEMKPGRESYAASFVEVIKEAREKIKNSKDKVQAGPEFLVSGGKPGDVRVKLLFSDEQIDGEKLRRFYLFELNDKDNLAGHREFIVQPWSLMLDGKEVKTATATGNVTTGIRNQGFLRPMESVTEYVLRNEAARLGSHDISWEIMNNNLYALQELRKQKAPDDPTLLAAENEQLRWKQFYGSFAKKDPDSEFNYHATVYPETNPIDLASTRSISAQLPKDNLGFEGKTGGEPKYSESEFIKKLDEIE